MWRPRAGPEVPEPVQIVLTCILPGPERSADDVVKGVRAMFRNESTRRTEVNLNELIEQVLVLTARTMDSSNVVLQTSLTDDPPLIVTVDPVQMQQVILNLVVNSIEAIVASGHEKRIVRIETWIDEAGSVVLTVTDSGPGFDSKVAGSLFAPFVSTKPSGMGMGLSICKSIVERHGGKLTAKSAAPSGAVFQVVLPTDGAS